MEMFTKPNILVEITLTQTLSTSLVDIFIILLHLADKFEEKYRKYILTFSDNAKTSYFTSACKGRRQITNSTHAHVVTGSLILLPGHVVVYRHAKGPY